MEESPAMFSLKGMNAGKLLLAVTVGFVLSPSYALAQNPYMFRITLRGMGYQTNATGNVVGTPITDQTLLQDAAAAGGIHDLKTLALVYHIGGSGFGDTIDIVNATNGTVYTTLYGLFFGDNNIQDLGRTALTNSSGTEVRRVDYIYTDQSTHSLGASFTSKRFLPDNNGKVHVTVDGQMQWIVNPVGGNGTKVCTATFTTTKVFASQP